ncbi:MAG: response regulator [Anaerolineae bacterium]
MSGSFPNPEPEGEQPEKIRVLIVDDIPETRENLRKLLFFDSDIEVVGAATNGEEGVQMAGELKPHIVLMDINMPGLDGISATEAIKQRVPYAQIIMMSVQGEADYLRRSMLAGAREFLIKPFSSDELISSIRRVYQLSASQREQAVPVAATAPPGALTPEPSSDGKVFAIFSPKGGVGCSTLAVNLAIAMQLNTRQKVALVDTSLQFGDVAVLLNLQAKRTIADLSSQADELDRDMLDSVMAGHPSGIKALLAPPRPEMADLVTPGLISSVLAQLRKAFDYIVVDTSSILQDMVLNVLDEADQIVLITTPEIPSIKNARLFFELTEALEYPPGKTKLVLNKADRRSNIRAEHIESSIKYKVEGQIPLDERTVITAVNQGVPFVMANGSSPLSQAMLGLANHLVQQLAKPEPAPAEQEQSKTPLGRLFSR